MSEPRTAAGQALLKAFFTDGAFPDDPGAAILAIEAQARPAVASEGLRAALETFAQLVADYCNDPAIVRQANKTLAALALASDAMNDLSADRLLTDSAAGQGPVADSLLGSSAPGSLARPAVASEGLQEALLDLMQHHRHHYLPNPLQRGPCDIAQNKADAALDAGSVGALDVERLARAIRSFAVAHRDEPDWTHPTAVDWMGDARAIAAAYDAKRQGEGTAQTAEMADGQTLIAGQVYDDESGEEVGVDG